MIYSDVIAVSSSKARTEYAKAVKSKASIDEQITENALLIISGNLGSTLADALEQDSKGESEPSHSTQLVELAEGAEFFHSPDGEGFVTFEVSDHKETSLVRSKAFKRWLMQRFYKENDKVASTQALQDALAVLEAKANFDGPECSVHLRIGGDKDTIYIDLGNDKWECVRITKDGWQVISDPPIKFRRAKGILPLPCPVGSGSIEDLFRFINVVDSSARQLIITWLIQSIMPKGPYPPLALHGGQGSAKSTSAAVLRALIDPNTSPLRSEPRCEHDLMIAANNGWVVCFDNLSRLGMGLSDSLCRLATGGGFSTRELYSDNDEILFNVMRPVIINGIEEVISRGDMLERTVILNLPGIHKKKRRAEEEFWADFEQAKPGILGALYDAISVVLRERPSVVLEELPRMADFARIGVAAETALGYEPGSFMRAYGENKQQANDLVLESEPVAEVTCAFIKREIEWSGRATDLLKELNRIADQKTQNLRSWPRQPQTLSNILRRLAPNLVPVGVSVRFDTVGHRKTRMIFLKYLGETSSASSASSAKDGSDENSEDEAGDPASSSSERPSADNYKETKDKSEENESADGADDLFRDFSNNGWIVCPTCGIGEGLRGSNCGECGDEIR
ncbi:MAG TPA: hypothetical protein VLR90_23785 [Blastocatellia bacterium]|nr:hypothetical protein [Blastocatellia bacterium]